jgi:hypothetical protein
VTEMRIDSFLLGLVTGVGLTLAGMGLIQILVTKGYTIAVELVEAGWTARELRAHRKAAVVLPYMQRMREQGGEQKFGSAR